MFRLKMIKSELSAGLLFCLLLFFANVAGLALKNPSFRIEGSNTSFYLVNLIILTVLIFYSLSKCRNLFVPLVGALAVNITLSVLWIYYGNVELRSDCKTYYWLSREFANTGDFFHLHRYKSFIGILFYSAAIKVFGDSLENVLLANIMLNTMNTVLIYFIAMALTKEKRISCLGAIIFALYPANIFFSGAVMVDGIFTLLLLMGMFFFLLILGGAENREMSSRSLKLRFFMFGICMGLVHLTRGYGILLFLGFCFSMLLFCFLKKKGVVFLVSILLSVLGFAVGICPKLATSVNYDGEVSARVFDRPWALVATGFGVCDGMKSKECWKSLGGYGVGMRQNRIESEKKSKKIFFDTLKLNPEFIIHRALAVKFRKMWQSDQYGIAWSLGGRQFQQRIRLDYDSTKYFAMVCDIYYTSMIMFAFMGSFAVWKKKRSETSFRAALLWLPFLLVVVMHFFVHAEPRYKLPFMPLIFIFSSTGIYYLRDLINVSENACNNYNEIPSGIS